jgi:hypothetical protein
MNSIKNYFASPVKLDISSKIDVVDVDVAPNEPATQNNNVEETENGVEPAVEEIDEETSEASDEAAKARNKKIYFNMESVLKSIAKSRRKKKCTKREKSKSPDEEGK